jgi:hypothetical protein
MPKLTSVTHTGSAIGPVIAYLLLHNSGQSIVLDCITVQKGGSFDRYSQMELIERYCTVKKGTYGSVERIDIVARGTGESNQGPFRFVWSAVDDVDADQCACNGMSITQLALS